MGDLVMGFHLPEEGRIGEEYQRSHPEEPVSFSSPLEHLPLPLHSLMISFVTW